MRVIIGDRHDRDAVDELLRRLGSPGAGKSHLLELPTLDSFDDVVEAVLDCRVAVGSRYHNLVAAFLVGRPCVSLEYGFKNRAIMEGFGLGEYCHHIDSFEPSVVLQQVGRLALDDVFERACRVKLEEFASELDAAYDRLLP